MSPPVLFPSVGSFSSRSRPQCDPPPRFFFARSLLSQVALVQLKVPLEIVPNTISKRKTEIAVAFDRGERMVGNDAFGQLSPLAAQP